MRKKHKSEHICESIGRIYEYTSILEYLSLNIGYLNMNIGNWKFDFSNTIVFCQKLSFVKREYYNKFGHSNMYLLPLDIHIRISEMGLLEYFPI